MSNKVSYWVFLSHSTKDKDLVDRLTTWIGISQLFQPTLDIRVYIAERAPEYGIRISEKISRNIDRCDCLLAILTMDGASSQWVNQEIGYAMKAGKPIIPIVEEGVEVKGLLADIEYIPFRKDSINDAVTRSFNYLQQLALQKEQAIRLQQQRQALGFIIFLGLLALAGKK